MTGFSQGWGLAMEYSRKRQGLRTTVLGLPSRVKELGSGRAGGGGGAGSPPGVQGSFGLCAVTESKWEEEIHADVENAMTWVNPRAPECKDILDSHPRCTHVHTRTYVHRHTNTQAHTHPFPGVTPNTVPFLPRAPSTSYISLPAIPTIALLTGTGTGPSIGLVSIALPLNKGETPRGRGTQLKACPLHPPSLGS